MTKRARLPESVKTVHLVDSMGRSWGSMTREDFEDAADQADVFQEALATRIAQANMTAYSDGRHDV